MCTFIFWPLFPWTLDGNVYDYDEIAESKKWRSDQPYQRRFGRLVCRPSLLICTMIGHQYRHWLLNFARKSCKFEILLDTHCTIQLIQYYLKIWKNLKRTHSGQKSDQSMFKSEHQRTGGQLYISINLPSSLPTPLSPSAQWNEPE